MFLNFRLQERLKQKRVEKGEKGGDRNGETQAYGWSTDFSS